MEIKEIAKIYTDFKEKFGIPRQSCRGKNLIGKIVFEPNFRNPLALREIESFSHLWLIFDFSLAHRKEFTPTVRPPRLGGNKRVGVFASRSPFRPNSLGLSSVRLLRVEDDEKFGKVLIVEGADILDGTPIFDIKPYLLSDSHPDAKVGYADAEHKLTVLIEDNLKIKIPNDKYTAVISCIEEDPRPSYHNESERIYKMKFNDFEVHFKVENLVATIVDVIV